MASILSGVFNVVVALLAPLGILIWFIAKRRERVLPFIVGAATFTISQMLLRIPLMQVLAGQAWYAAFANTQPVIFSLLVGLSAGVFEEVGRYIAMRIMKRHQSWGDAVSFGLGHGGIEAILLVGINNLLLLLLSSGTLTVLSPLQILPAGAERISAVMFHVGASVMVMRAVQGATPGKKVFWLMLAVLIHGIMDGMLGILQMWGWGTLAIEAYAAVFGLGMLAFTLLTRPKTTRNSEVLQHEENV